jgi:hypothetical protein
MNKFAPYKLSFYYDTIKCEISYKTKLHKFFRISGKIKVVSITKMRVIDFISDYDVIYNKTIPDTVVLAILKSFNVTNVQLERDTVKENYINDKS